MNPRSVINGVLVLASLGLISTTVLRARQLARLKAEAFQIGAEMTAQAAPVPAVASPGAAAESGQRSEADLLELMRLRNEVAQLRQRQRELANAQAENNALRQRVAAAAPVSASAVALPPGYIRRKDAQLTGYQTPEAALQSFIWAIANKNTNTLFQVLDREGAGNLLEDLQRKGPDEFWKEVSIIPGFRIIGNRANTETSSELTVEFAPGDEQKITAVKNGEEWKLILH
jgi:hypothetical protein